MNPKIIKIIKATDLKQISIIDVDNQAMLLKKAVSQNNDTINMLRNEANILTVLKECSFVPKLFAYNFDDNSNYEIIELIKGKTIDQIEYINDQEKIELIIKIINIVKIMHSYNVIHCDLKTSNILLDINGNIKIIDFEIASSDGINHFKPYASLRYCSPDRILTQDINFHTDLYAIGVIFYELMIGYPPFRGTRKEIETNKINGAYSKCNNELLNNIFSKLFVTGNEYKYLDEFKHDLEELLNKDLNA